MTLLLLTGAVTFFLLLSALIGKSPKLVLYSITAFSVAAWDFPTPPAVGSVGGASVFLEDGLTGAMVLAVTFRPQRFLSVLRPYMIVAVVSLLAVTAALLYGAVEFGPQGLNEFRSFLYPLAAVAWSMNQDWNDSAWQHIVRRWAIVTGLLLSLTAVAHIALYGLGRVDSFVQSVLTGAAQTGRPLTAGQAILLALTAMYLLQGVSSKSRADIYWAAFFIAVTLVAQHRSVWIALAAGCVVLFFKVHGVARARLVVGGLVAAWLATVLVLCGVFDPFTEQLASSVDNLGTYDARTDSWKTLIDKTVEGGIGPVSFGSPFGSGFARFENGVMVEWAPHNWYVTVYLRLGLIGLSVFLVMLILVLARLLKRQDAGPAAAVFAMILTYCWAYSLPWQIAPFFAWAMFRAGERNPRQVEPAPLPAGYLTSKWAARMGSNQPTLRPTGRLR